MSYQHAHQEAAPKGPPEAPHEEQRSALFEMLRAVDFAQGQEALEPTDKAPKSVAPVPKHPTLPPSTLERLAALLGTAINEVEAEADAPAPKNLPVAKDAKQTQETAEAAEAIAEMEKDAAESAPAEKTPPAPKRGPKKKNARAPKKATGLLNYAQAKRALRWTRQRNFARSPMLMRRYSMVLPTGLTSRPNFAFVQGVAKFQKSLGMRPTGHFLGKPVRVAQWRLKKFYGLDKKQLLTAREVKLARANAKRMMARGLLKRKTIKEMRTLLGMGAGRGEMSGTFLRRLALFQRQNGLTPGAFISKRTVKKLRATKKPAIGPNASNATKLAYAKRMAPKHGLVITSTTGGQHTAGSYHYSARAIDVAGSASGMSSYYRAMKPLKPTELFYDPEGGIKYGQEIGAIGGHRDHVHVAF